MSRKRRPPTRTRRREVADGVPLRAVPDTERRIQLATEGGHAIAMAVERDDDGWHVIERADGVTFLDAALRLAEALLRRC